MIALVDANALLWWLAGDRTLSRAAARAIRDPDNDVLVSAATIWEIEIKRSLGKLQAPDGITDTARAAGFDILPITGADAERAARLPRHHRDPFDRMLVAQALRLEAVIVTRDARFAAYGIDVIRA